MKLSALQLGLVMLLSLFFCSLPANVWAGVTVVHQFGYNGSTNFDGSKPTSGVVEDNNGNFYGVTVFGGTHGTSGGGDGVLYELSPSGGGYTETILHDFAGTSDGANPSEANLYIDNSGSAPVLYGTTEQTVFEYDFTTTPATYTVLLSKGSVIGVIKVGSLLYGVANSGVTKEQLFSYDLSHSTYTDLHEFGTGTDGFNVPATIAVGSGVIYGTCLDGGANSEGTIWSYDPTSSTYSQLYSFTAGSDGGLPDAGATLYLNGKLYGGTETGGVGRPPATGFGVIFQFDPSTSTLTTLHELASNDSEGKGAWQSLVPNSAGTVLYGTTGTPFGVVYSLTISSGAFTVLVAQGDQVGAVLNLVGTTLWGTNGTGASPSQNGYVFTYP